jgi:HSP20 family protein
MLVLFRRQKMVELRSDWTEIVVTMQREMERLLDDFSSRKPPSVRFSPRTWAPAVDVFETADEVVVLFELAGVKEEQIEVEVYGKELIVRGERQDVKQGISRSYTQMEILWGPFERKITLPAAVEVERTKAFYENGFLEIVLPKSKPQVRRRVEIKSE